TAQVGRGALGPALEGVGALDPSRIEPAQAARPDRDGLTGRGPGDDETDPGVRREARDEVLPPLADLLEDEGVVLAREPHRPEVAPADDGDLGHGPVLAGPAAHAAPARGSVVRARGE